ncbi:MAG: DUF554 domain-containing protein [Aquificaceae bacterium]|nr:DUF554 domain-containing protein [Aquificaceae bacterium]MDW8096971.1 DUF554 family protein [Aquificaceae bacterium]
MFPTFGSLVNAGLVLVGSLIGLRFSSSIPERLRTLILQSIGLFTLMLGVKLMADNQPELLKVFFLLLGGALLGSLLRLEESLEGLTRGKSSLSAGFVSASLLFTVGPMTLVGCILEGSKGDSSLLLSKALMDGFSSVVLSSSLGKGVALSALYVLLFQSSITLLAHFYGDFLRPQAMANTLFVGGGLMVATGLKILGLLREFKVLNLMPSLLLALFL